MDLPPGTTFGGYQIIEKLGRGGMATVYKAHEPALARFVALKVLPAELLDERDFAIRFKREAEVLARLEHPNIVPIHAFGIDDRVPWMAMRLIDGGSLARLLGRNCLELAEVVALLEPVAKALDHAHSKGVVHRDVKPQNILVDSHRSVYLADFGIARLTEGVGVRTRTRAILGTPEYMSPEQAQGHDAGPRSDVYALGVVAYQALTGAVPFSADTPMAVLMKQVSDPIPLPPPTRVSEAATRVLLRALAKSPADRWPSATAFVAELAFARRAQSGSGTALSSAATLARPTTSGIVPAQAVQATTQPAAAARPTLSSTAATRTAPTRMDSRKRLWAAIGVLAVALAAAGTLLWVAGDRPAARPARPAAAAGGGIPSDWPTAPPAPRLVAISGQLRTVGFGTRPSGVDFVDTRSQEHNTGVVTATGHYSVRVRNDRTYAVFVSWSGLLGLKGTCHAGVVSLHSEEESAAFSGGC